MEEFRRSKEYCTSFDLLASSLIYGQIPKKCFLFTLAEKLSMIRILYMYYFELEGFPWNGCISNYQVLFNTEMYRNDVGLSKIIPIKREFEL